MADQVVDVIFELGAPQFKLIDFLVGGKIDFFFDAINGVIEPVIFIEHFPEMIIGPLEAPDRFSVFGELS